MLKVRSSEERFDRKETVTGLNSAAANDGIASQLQSTRLVAAVAILGHWAK
jgi:hypothetical protein